MFTALNDVEAGRGESRTALSYPTFFLAAKKKSGILSGTVGSLSAVSLSGDRHEETVLCFATGTAAD